MNESHLFIHPDFPGDARRGQAPFASSFEDMCLQLERLPGAVCEPDGAICWNPAGDGSETLGGTIHCIDQRVMCVELFSRLRLENWKKLHEAISSGLPTIIQLPRKGRFVSVSEFERSVYNL